MIVISGPSASGKTEVAKLLQDKYGFTKVITTTTRNKRVGEKDGVDYFFITKEKFLEKIANGDFVEYMEYNGNNYGSTKDQLGHHRVIVTDLNGLNSYINLGNRHVVTFYLTANEHTRFERMITRGDGDLSAQNRIAADKEVFSKKHIKGVNFYIKNNNRNLEDVAKEVFDKYNEYLKSL